MSVLGVVGLVLAFVFMNNSDSSKHLSLLLASGIGGTLIFFMGIWMVPRVGAGVRPGMGASVRTGMGAGVGARPSVSVGTADSE